jgi:amino acid transporter
MATDDNRDVLEAGYQPQLERNIGRFASFAVPYSFMSVLVGVFANYSFVLNTAGPFGFWTWLIVGAGQFILALVFAEMASRLPLTGSLYNWNSRLNSPVVAWLVAWVLIFGYTISVPAIIFTMLAPLQSLFGFTLGSTEVDAVGIGIILIQLLINVYGIRFTAHLNRAAVILEIVALVGFGLLLAFVLTIKGGYHPQYLTTVPLSPVPYWPGFLMCFLLAAFTVTGFETASDLSEETLNPKYVAPRSVIYSVLSSVLLGFFFIVVLTLAIPNLANITAAADPISSIFSFYLGVALTRVFLGIVLLAMFALAMLTMTLASRLLFAVARDKHVVGWSWLGKVSSRKIPANALLLIALFEILAFVFLSGLAALFATPSLLLILAYLVTAIGFALKPNALPEPSGFSLGSFRTPIVFAAIAWLIIEVLVLTLPQPFNLAAFICIAIVLIGAAQYIFVERTRLKRSSTEISS